VQGDDKSKKKKVMKASEKFRFNFDWDGKEDTSKDLNPLYNHLHREWRCDSMQRICTLSAACRGSVSCLHCIV
jgi:hypothetical protein